MIRGTLFLSLLTLFLPVSGSAHPCEKETEELMSIASSWVELYKASLVLPSKCFDGYFAEGISDTVVRKIALDWPGFLAIWGRQPRDKRFVSLVSKSFNATLNPDHIQAANHLAKTSCPRQLTKQCTEISHLAVAALADYDPPVQANDR